MPNPTRKLSYTVPCPSPFRDAVEALAARRNVNVGDLARSVLLMVPPEVIGGIPDPGEPARDDRETVTLKSGPGIGRPWRRKPRLQVRIAAGYAITTVRRALALALALDDGRRAIRLADPHEDRRQAETRRKVAESEIETRLNGRIERLRAAMTALSFDPLPDGVRTRDEALHVLGFPPGIRPEERLIRARFRVLATIHHPDGEFGSHERMSQINAAMDLLRRG